MGNPTDADFRYIGFTERQINQLINQPGTLRLAVYEEGLRLLMETGPGYTTENRSVAI